MLISYSNRCGPKILADIRLKKGLKRAFYERFLYLFPEAYLEPSRTNTMELFAEMAKSR